MDGAWEGWERLEIGGGTVRCDLGCGLGLTQIVVDRASRLVGRVEMAGTQPFCVVSGGKGKGGESMGESQHTGVAPACLCGLRLACSES